MKKWLIIGLILLLIVLGGSISVYVKATEPLRAAEVKALDIAENETNLSGFHEFELYHGEETYYVLKANNQQNEEVNVWISEKNKNIIIEKTKNGVSKEEAIKTVEEDRNPDEIISVRLGITRIHETNRPAWEIYYRSENGNLNYYYVDFETGEKLRAIDNF